MSILSRRQKVLPGRHQQNQAGRVRDRAAEAVLRACSVRRKQDSSEDYASKHSGCLRQMRKHVPDLLPAYAGAFGRTRTPAPAILRPASYMPEPHP